MPEVLRAARATPRRWGAKSILRATFALGIVLGAAGYVGLVACARVEWLGDVAASFRPQVALGMCGAIALLIVLRTWIAAAFVALCAGFAALPWVHVTLASVPIVESSTAHGPGGSARRELRVVSANVLMHNRELDAFRDWLARESPDVLAVQEFPTHWREPLNDFHGIFENGILFPEPSDPRSATWFAIGLFTHLPVVSKRIVPLDEGFPPVLELIVDLDGARWTFRTIHPVAPASRELWRKRNRLLARIASELTWDDHTILIGDFNTSSGSGAWSDFTAATGLRDSRVGFGWQPTWATDQKIRGIWTDLDHLLVGGSVGVLERRLTDVPGSDHRGIAARLELMR